MPVETELYDVLGVSPNASEGTVHPIFLRRGESDISVDEIKKAYRKKVRLLARVHALHGTDYII